MSTDAPTNPARIAWVDRASILWSPASYAAWIAAAATAIAYGPLLVEYFRNLGGKEYYQHYPFVLAAFVWLLTQRIVAASPRSPIEQSYLGRPAAASFALLAWGMLALAYATGSPWSAYLSLIVLIGAALIYAATLWHIDGLAAVWLLLWLIVPPPLNRDQNLINSLQRISSQASSFLLDSLGVSHLMEGNMLTLPDKQLFVDEACSGIISVMSIIACAAIYGVWRRRSAAHVTVLIAAGVAWATTMNTFRISSIAYLYSHWGVDWSKGAPHEILSLCVFTLTFLALISSDVLLTGLLAPVALAWEEHDNRTLSFGHWLATAWDWTLGHRPRPIVPPPNPPTERGPLMLPRWSPLLRVAVPLLFVALPAWHVLSDDKVQFAAAATPNSGPAALARALALQEAFLPQRVGALRLERFDMQERSRDDAMGNHSRSHLYVDSRGNSYLVSCDFAYEGGWHELTLCYQGVGWTLDERRVPVPDANVRKEAGAAESWTRMEADLSKPDGTKAFVIASAFDDLGQRLDLPTYSLWEGITNVLMRKKLVAGGQYAFQTQVWMTSEKPISDEQRAAGRALLFAARSRFRELVVKDAAAAAADSSPATSAPLTAR